MSEDVAVAAVEALDGERLLLAGIDPLDITRAVLDVAEPLIREQVANAAARIVREGE